MSDSRNRVQGNKLTFNLGDSDRHAGVPNTTVTIVSHTPTQLRTPDRWRNRGYIQPHKVIFAFASNQALRLTPLPVALLFSMSYPRVLKPLSGVAELCIVRC